MAVYQSHYFFHQFGRRSYAMALEKRLWLA
jgi:hypothetical protein